MVSQRWSIAQLSAVASPCRRAAVAVLLAFALVPVPVGHHSSPPVPGIPLIGTSQATPVNNFSASINRLVDLVALAGSGILSLVWARVALSWFSNDITKKIQAKDRARDALIGTLLFMAAITGLLYGLAHWVLTGS